MIQGINSRVVSVIIFGCILVICLTQYNSTKKETVNLAVAIKKFRFDQIDTISMVDLATNNLVWDSKNISEKKWRIISKHLFDYLNWADMNKLGAVRPTHKILIKTSFFEISILAYGVLDREGKVNEDIQKLIEFNCPSTAVLSEPIDMTE